PAAPSLTLPSSDASKPSAPQMDGQYPASRPSPKAERAATKEGGKAGMLRVVLEHTLSGHKDDVRSAVFSPDGQHVITASRDNTARLWDVRTGDSLAVLSGHSDSVWIAAFSPDGSRIVTASSDKTARIWDATTGASLYVLSGHSDTIESA